MKTQNTFSVSFCLKSQKLKAGKAPLFAQITVDGVRKLLSLKHWIEPSKWNKNKEQVAGNDPVTKSINKYIDQIRGQLFECYRELQGMKQEISAISIKNKFIGIEEEEHSLLSLISYHNKTMNEKLAWGTAKNYFTTQKYIKEFLLNKKRVSDLRLSELNYKFLADFEMFLRNRKPVDHQKPCDNNTIMKHIERFRKIINMAIRNEWLIRDPFQKFQPKFIKKDRGYLTEEELLAIENKAFSIERILVIRDMFIFSCYTGLTYSDAKKLTENEIFKGIDGGLWLYTNRQKTKIRAEIPLLPKAIEIIEKYKSHAKANHKQTILPMVCNQNFNQYLKEIADICGIRKNLTHHLARHTFATTVCIANGISIEAVSSMLGHASIRTTQVYGKIVPKRVSTEMNLLRQKLSEEKTTTLAISA